MEVNKEGFYVSELKTALDSFQEIEKEVSRLAEEKRKRTKMVKSLITVLTCKLGEKGAREFLEKKELIEQAQQFLNPEYQPLPQSRTVGRSRKGKKRIVTREEVLAKGTMVRVTAGKYMGYAGRVASTAIRQTAKGLDVTYFLTLSRGRSMAKRTSVKHGTLGRTWEVIE